MDQTVEPRDVALDGLGVVLGQGAEIAICDRPGPAIGESLRQRVAPPLQQREPDSRLAEAAEGELHVERTLVVSGVGDELAQASVADLGDAIDLLAARPARRLAACGAERGGLAG